MGPGHGLHVALAVDAATLSRSAHADLQALKARGEPLLSGFECTPEGMAAHFKPHSWRVLELLSPRLGPFCLACMPRPHLHPRQPWHHCRAACRPHCMH